MTINGSAHYATAASFRRAVEDRLKTASRSRGETLHNLRREFIFQRFLALVFAAPTRKWVLKGGGGLLMRMTEARFSQDLDLLRLGSLTYDQAIAELRDLTRPSTSDHLTFIIGESKPSGGTNPVVEISVTAYIGAVYETFPIDLSKGLATVSTPELIRPVAVVDVPGLPDPPQVLVYPLSDQVADKVCAMFELHGPNGIPSSRYRDLYDLALIISTSELDGYQVSMALDCERVRRGVILPREIRSPGGAWSTGYSSIARRTRISTELHSMAAALELVGRCLNPILSGDRSEGVWTPTGGWTPRGL